KQVVVDAGGAHHCGRRLSRPRWRRLGGRAGPGQDAEGHHHAAQPRDRQDHRAAGPAGTVRRAGSRSGRWHARGFRAAAARRRREVGEADQGRQPQGAIGRKHMLDNRIRVFIIAVLIAVGAEPAAAQMRPKLLDSGVARPASAIYIGNSFFYYNNSMHNHVSLLLRAADPAYRLRTTSVTISGSGSDWHDVESYFRPNAIGTYSFDADNNVVFNKIDGRLFDLAILMDCSQCPIHPQLKSVFYDF